MQTYFHKSCKLVEEAIPFEDNLEGELATRLKRNKPICNRIGKVLQRLSGVNCEMPSPEASISVQGTAQLTGASKRKPKVVRRIVDSPESEEDSKQDDSFLNFDINTSFPLEAFNSQQILMLAELSSTVAPLVDSANHQNSDVIADEDLDVSVVPDWCWQELITYIASVSGVCEEIRSRLRAAISDVYTNKMTLQDACLTHNLGFNYLSHYYEAFLTRLRKQARFITSLLSGRTVDEACRAQDLEETPEFNGETAMDESLKAELVLIDRKRIKMNEDDVLPPSSEKIFDNGKDVIGRKHKDREKYGPPLDPSDSERLKAIEEGVIEACRPSTYNDTQKKKLHMAVSMVVRGEGPVSIAASKSHLPPSTVQLYAQRTRMALGSLLPPPAASLRRSLASQETGRLSVEKSTGSEKNWSRESKEKDSLELYETQSSSSKRRFGTHRDVDADYLEIKNISQGADPLDSSALSDLAVQMLAKVDFNAVLSAEVKCTKEELMRKIDAILRNFHYQNDYAVMRDALLGIFLEGKTVDEVCQLSKLKAQEVGAYMALVKVYCESKKQEFRKDTEDDEGEVRAHGFFDDISHRKVTRRSTSSLRSSTDLTLQRKSEPTYSSEASVKSREGSSESILREQESSAVLDKVDVMFLHSDTVRGSEELCMKNIIAYLVQQQYRRSKDSQDKLRLCLENVLLDGLHLKETLMLIRGPSEHVLQAYVARCRDAKSCITNDFSCFLSESLKLLEETDFEHMLTDDSFAAGTRRSDTSTSSTPSFSRTPRKTKKNAQLSDPKIPTKIEGLTLLNQLLTEEVLKPLTAYLEKLSAINFPIETSLITGLVKIILQHVPSQFELNVSDGLWLQWADEYRDKHLKFYH